MNYTTKELLDKLRKLSHEEKYEVVQMVWEDIARENSSSVVSPSHQSILEERLKKISTNETKFKSWDDLKGKYTKPSESLNYRIIKKGKEY